MKAYSVSNRNGDEGYSLVVPTIMGKPQKCYCMHCGSFNEGAER